MLSLKKVLCPLLLITGALVSGCSSDDTTATTNEFSSLPEVTGPVSSNAGSAISSLLASTGVVLADVSSSTFPNNTYSVQMCENVNLLKEVLREAAGADKILCYMSAMKSSGVIPATVNATDGEYHYIKLQNLPDSGGTNEEPLVKFKITKTNGTISSFEMFSCFSGTTNSPTQSEYISQTFSGTTATVVSKNTGSEGTASYGSSMTASGVFSSGAWQSKNITGYRYYDDSGNANKTTLDIDQYADQLWMSIAMEGLYSGNSFSNQFYTVAQLLGSSLATMAIGDGSSKVSMTYDQGDNGSDEFSQTTTVSWNGDTQQNLGTASNGVFYSNVNGATLPAAASGAAITFTGSEAWDCSLPSGQSWVSADFDTGGTAITAGMGACEDKYLGNNNWVNCPYQ